MDPEDLGDGTEAATVTVTAELADGFEWGQLGNWTPRERHDSNIDAGVGRHASCDEVTPADPDSGPRRCAPMVCCRRPRWW